MADQGDLVKMKKAIMKATKADDLREEMHILATRDIQWENFLEPAPLSIALLGQLILISCSTQDFPLNKSIPEGGFKYMTHPGSFRASLVQVGNEGYNAFAAAHTNMDQIRLHTNNVPIYVKDAVKIITSGTARDVVRHLPKPLKAMEDISDECLRLATCTEEKFVTVMELIGELLEVCTEAKGKYEDEKTKAKNAEARLAIAREAMLQKKMEDEKQVKGYEEKLNNAEDDYKEAMKSMKSGWKLYGMHVLERVVKMVTVFGGLAEVIHGSSTCKTTMAQASDVEEKPREDAKTSENNLDKEVYKKTTDLGLNSLCMDLDGLLKDSDLRNDRSGKMNNKIKNIKDTCESFNSAINDISGEGEGDSEVKKDALAICSNLLQVCSELDDITSMHAQMRSGSEGQGDRDQKMQYLSQLCVELVKKSKVFDSKSCVATGNGPDIGSTPRMAKFSTQFSGESNSAVSSVLHQQHFKVNTSLEFLHSTQQKLDDKCRERNETSQKLVDVISELAECDLKTVNFKEIADYLNKGMNALGEVREQWGKLVEYFSSLSNVTKCCLKPSVERLSGYLETDVVDQPGVQFTFSDCMLDVIYHAAFRASGIAHVLNHVSSIYVGVSSKHLMNQVASLGALMGLDPDEDKDKIQEKLTEILVRCKLTQTDIRDHVQREQATLNSAIRARCEQLESVLPFIPVPPAIAEENKNIAAESIARAEEELDEDQW